MMHPLSSSTARRRPPASTTAIDVRGLAFRVRSTVRSTVRSSTAHRAPVVLVHGIGMSHRYLARLHEVLATSGPVHSIDMAGYAGLPKPQTDIDVATMGRALGDVVAALGIGPVALFGHSMGTQWAVEAALHRPDLVRLLVTMGPVADAAHRTMSAQMRALALDTMCEPPTANAIVLTDYVRCGVPWYLAQLRHMLAYRIEDRVPLLPMPLLIIRGGRDPIAGTAWCRQLRDTAPDGRLAVIPGQFHLAQHARPRAVASAVLSHVADSPPARLTHAG